MHLLLNPLNWAELALPHAYLRRGITPWADADNSKQDLSYSSLWCQYMDTVGERSM